jgi:hypothetical protein
MEAFAHGCACTRVWPRGTDFSQLPSAVISTVDPPLGSPSLFNLDIVLNTSIHRSRMGGICLKETLTRSTAHYAPRGLVDQTNANRKPKTRKRMSILPMGHRRPVTDRSTLIRSTTIARCFKAMYYFLEKVEEGYLKT